MTISSRFLMTVSLVIVLLLVSANVTALAQTDRARPTITAQEEKETYVSGLTSGRAKSLVGVALGLISVVIGRRANRNIKRLAVPVVAILLGIVAIVLGIVQLTSQAGGFGTGGGKAGAIVALVLGASGVVVNARTLRSWKAS